MKKTVMTGLSAAALVVLTVACSDFGQGYGSGSGRINPTVGIDTEVASSRAASRAEYDAVTDDDLSITLTKLDGSMKQTWERIADFPIDRGFSIGDYSIEAFYGDPDEQGFEKPAFYGVQNIKVADGVATEVSLTASLANAMISIDYTDAFKNYMASYAAALTTANGKIEYPADETRPAYVSAGNVDINISVTKPNGLSANFKAATVNAQPQHHYMVHVDVNNGNVGDATLVITFDDNLNVEPVEIDLSDKLLSAAAPTAVADGFTPGEPVDFVAGMGSQHSLKMNLVAMAGLKSVKMTTKSASLIEKGWPEQIDLMAADADNQAKLRELGLDVLGLWRSPDKMAVIDFSDVLKHIDPVPGNKANSFAVVVEDKLSRVSEPELVLDLNVENPMLELVKDDAVYSPGSPLHVQLNFNASDVENNVSFQYWNVDVANWRPLTVNSVSAASRAMYAYTVELQTPANIEYDLRIRAVCQGYGSNELVVETAPFLVAGNDNDTYATHAYVTVAGRNGAAAPEASTITFVAKAAGDADYQPVSHVVRDGYFEINGLAASTEYKIKAVADGMMSMPVTITTETPGVLPNADLEKSVKEGNYNEYKIEGWGTNNPMTTSQGIESASYARISCTVPNSAGRNGQCAELRTAAWGKGNAALLSVSASTVKYFDAGLLHLGASRTVRPSGYSERPGCLDTNDLDCGIAFDSRPSALEFWYRYEAKNPADRGFAEIWVKDADGALVAHKTASLDPAADFSKITIDLDYPLGAHKAAKIYVRFQSTNDAARFDKTSDNFTARLAKDIIGSHLYVDDINLIY